MTSYFTASNNADADAIAALLPAALIPAYLALSDATAKADLLAAASYDIDTACRFQGRKYDVISQVLEFPRVAYESSTRILPNTGPVPIASAWSDVVWDFDPVALVAVVPAKVLMAVIYQANYLAGGEDSRVNDQFVGLKGERVGSLSAEYGPSEAMKTGLCRRAWQLVKRYRLQSGRLL